MLLLLLFFTSSSFAARPTLFESRCSVWYNVFLSGRADTDLRLFLSCSSEYVLFVSLDDDGGLLFVNWFFFLRINLASIRLSHFIKKERFKTFRVIFKKKQFTKELEGNSDQKVLIMFWTIKFKVIFEWKLFSFFFFTFNMNRLVERKLKFGLTTLLAVLFFLFFSSFSETIPKAKELDGMNVFLGFHFIFSHTYFDY